MSNEKHETIADIVSAMRDESHAGDASCLEWVGEKMRSYADRIEAANDIDCNEKMRKEVDLYKKTFRKICECLNKDIEVGAPLHKVDGSSTFLISDCGALPIIYEIAKIIEDTVKEGEECKEGCRK